MIIQQLRNELLQLFPVAEEVYIAVALAKEVPLAALLNLIPPNIEQKIIVGLDLPTTVNALKLLQRRQKENDHFKAVMYYDNSITFHPKMYIVKSFGKFTAFIGSANLTDGGLENNIELTYKIEDQNHCLDLLKWFGAAFEESAPINDYNINQYDINIDSHRDKRIFSKPILKLSKPKPTLMQLFNNIDFSNRYFERRHHYAFREEIWKDDSRASLAERKEVEEKFLELSNYIFPRFYQFGINDMSTNTEGNIVSKYWQINPSNPRNLNAMWLSYGKSQDEIKQYKKEVGKDESENQTFIHHARLQIRIELTSIGIWILFGKEYGSSFDRDYFKTNMRQPVYRENFYRLIKALPDTYWIRINTDKLKCSDFKNAQQLHDLCKKDKIEHYFIIGRDYNIMDEEMSADNFASTVLREFGRQFPIYKMMKHKLNA